ncbi:hypothetical protein M8J77_008868 [Diaphorina citri]|nr:hypothetical protein M8J77_008868 [Diaphorina citri]
MSLTNRVEECIDVIETRKLHVLGLSETKRKGQRNEELRDGYHLYWSGGETAVNQVAIILSHQIKERVVNVHYMSARIIQIIINTDQDQNVNLIQCYAPQTGLTDEEKILLEEMIEEKICRRRKHSYHGISKRTSWL